MFYILEYMFDSAPISTCLVSKSEAVSIECSVETHSRIDETHGVVEVVFLVLPDGSR